VIQDIMQLCSTFILILMTLASFISALPLNPGDYPMVGSHVVERSPPVTERITLKDA